MKKIFLCIVILLCLTSVSNASYSIVNNSGSTPADSLVIPFYALDSAGNVVAMASGDSVFLNVYYPSGALAYRDSLAYNGTKITTQAVSDYTEYTWKEAVATIDGTPVQGAYSYILIVNDQTSAALSTPHKGHFQLLTESDFNTSVEYVKDVLDTLQNQDDWISAEFTKVKDSLNAILDTLQLWDTRIDSLENALADASIGDKVWTDGTPANRTFIIDSLQAIIDSIQIKFANRTAYDPATDSVIIDLSSAETTGKFFAMMADSVWANATRSITGDSYTPDVNVTSIAADAITAAAIAADAIGASEIATNAITATKIATDAIGVSELALSAINYIATGVWTIAGPDDSSYTAGTMGKDAEGWDLTGASGGVDSTVLSNVLRRVVYGVAVGSGSDSTTLAQRKVKTEQLANDVITAAAIAADAIGVSEIAGGAITALQIADNAITAAKIATNAIGASEIAADAIGASEIATNAIGATEIAPDAIGASEIATGAIDADAIATGAIDADAIATDAIGAAEIAANAIGASEIATNAIGAAEIAGGAIDNAAFATDAISASKIAANAIGNSEFDAVDEIWNYLLASIGTPNSIGQLIKDSLGNIDYIVDKVWDEDTAGHKTDPHMGFWITQAGASSGDGIVEVDFIFYDTTNSFAMADAQLVVKTTGGATVFYGDALESGRDSACFINGNKYYTYYYEQGYTAPTIDSFTCTASLQDTLWFEEITFGVPLAGHICRVTINVKNSQGQPDSGIVISAWLDGMKMVDSSGAAVTNITQHKKTDSNGQVWFDCLYSEYMIPATKWWFASGKAGNFRKKYIVPQLTSITLDLSQ